MKAYLATYILCSLVGRTKRSVSVCVSFSHERYREAGSHVRDTDSSLASADVRLADRKGLKSLTQAHGDKTPAGMETEAQPRPRAQSHASGSSHRATPNWAGPPIHLQPGWLDGNEQYGEHMCVRMRTCLGRYALKPSCLVSSRPF